MFIIVKHGGKQYWAEKGSILALEKINATEGEEISLSVIYKNGANEKSEVKAKVLKQYKDKKVIIFKKKRRHHYERKKGHRQLLTNVLIENI